MHQGELVNHVHGEGLEDSDVTYVTRSFPSSTGSFPFQEYQQLDYEKKREYLNQLPAAIKQHKNEIVDLLAEKRTLQKICHQLSEHKFRLQRLNTHLAGPRVEDVRFAAAVEHVVPVSWAGGLVLKNTIFTAKFHKVRGDSSTFQLLPSVLNISQRLRLDPHKINDVKQRLGAITTHAVLVGVPSTHSSPPADGTVIYNRPLKDMIRYLRQKSGAGVVHLQSSGGLTTGVVYVFPPCHFSYEFLRGSSPNIIEDSTKEDHVVVIVITGPVRAHRDG